MLEPGSTAAVLASGIQHEWLYEGLLISAWL